MLARKYELRRKTEAHLGNVPRKRCNMDQSRMEMAGKWKIKAALGKGGGGGHLL